MSSRESSRRVCARSATLGGIHRVGVISPLLERGANLHRGGAAPVDRRQAKVIADQSSSEASSRSRELPLLRSRTPANANPNRAPGFHILRVLNRRAGGS